MPIRELRRILMAALLVAVVVQLPLPLLAQDGTAVPKPAGIAAYAAQIVALAGVITGVLQGLKKIFPVAISGKVAVGLNMVLSLLAAVAECQADPAQVFSLGFLLKLALIALSAAGIHDVLRRERSFGT
jgi:hypothetical protein